MNLYHSFVINPNVHYCGNGKRNCDEFTMGYYSIESINACNSMNDFQNKYAELKKPDKERVYTVWFYLYKILEHAN